MRCAARTLTTLSRERNGAVSTAAGSGAAGKFGAGCVENDNSNAKAGLRKQTRRHQTQVERAVGKCAQIQKKKGR